jgi:hypothetical protein
MSLRKNGKVSDAPGRWGREEGEEEEEEGKRILAEWKRLIKEHTRRLIRSTPSPSMLISLSSALASNDSKGSFKQVAGGVEGALGTCRAREASHLSWRAMPCCSRAAWQASN